MRPIRIHDERSNEYLSEMFFAPLMVYCHDRGIDIAHTSAPVTEEGKLILIHGDRLNPEKIDEIKQRNQLVVFDINDSSYISSAYTGCRNFEDIDLIFKVSGIPTVNETPEVNLDRNFKVQLSAEKFLPDEEWTRFHSMHQAGRIKSLPYVLWRHVAPPGGRRPLGSRQGKVLVRGGNHFWRVVLALHLMQNGLIDNRSGFMTEDYFKDTMEKRFQYCESCIKERDAYGKALFDAPLRHKECTNPATCWHLPGEFFGGPLTGRREHGYWNNRCPHSFFFLAKQFEEHRGPIDHAMFERMMNGRHNHVEDFMRDLADCRFTADLKWLNTIYLPPRFWEAASVGTVSLFPERTSLQEYWPKVRPGVHYWDFKETMDEWHMPWDDQWEDISQNVYELYESKIKGTQYRVSNALLEHIVNSIEEVSL